MSKKKKIDDATRITLYFSKNEAELLEFVQNNDEGVKRNTFIMNLIREAFESEGKDKVSKQRKEEYSTLLDEIRDLKQEQLHQFELERTELLNEIKTLKELIKNIKVVSTQMTEDAEQELELSEDTTLEQVGEKITKLDADDMKALEEDLVF